MPLQNWTVRRNPRWNVYRLAKNADARRMDERMTRRTILRRVKGGWARDRAKGGAKAAIAMRLGATGDGAWPPTGTSELLPAKLVAQALSPLVGLAPAGLHMPATSEQIASGEGTRWRMRLRRSGPFGFLGLAAAYGSSIPGICSVVIVMSWRRGPRMRASEEREAQCRYIHDVFYVHVRTCTCTYTVE